VRQTGRQFRWLRLFFLLALAGCNSQIAEKFVSAPNRDLPIRGTDAPAAILAANHVSRQLRVAVGPPDATLSVWIVDPSPAGSDAAGGPALMSDASPSSGNDPPAQTRPSPVKSCPRGTLFLLHGLLESKEDVPMHLYSSALAREGYRVVLVDLRGHGRSTGDRISYGGRESHDMVQVLTALEQQNLIAGRVGAVGISYGASVAICWAAIDSRVRAVVAMEPFSSIRYAAVDAGAEMLMGLPRIFTRGDFNDITDRIGRLDGFDPDLSSPLYAIARMTTPVLLIHGKADDFLHPSHSIRLHEANPAHTELILVENADHFDLWSRAMRLILFETNGWFEKYLPVG
jgi:pimeloyl-ACP methyl ester carboxylesterase